MTTALRAHIRWMVRSDLDDVLDIERASFEHCWSEGDFIKMLRQQVCIGMVADHGEKLVGYMVYEIYPTRIQVVNFAVAPHYRRLSVGRQLVEKLQSKLRRERNRLVFDVREVNLTAQLFLQATGLVAVKILPAYFDNGETAYRFEYRKEC